MFMGWGLVCASDQFLRQEQHFIYWQSRPQKSCQKTPLVKVRKWLSLFLATGSGHMSPGNLCERLWKWNVKLGAQIEAQRQLQLTTIITVRDLGGLITCLWCSLKLQTKSHLSGRRTEPGCRCRRGAGVFGMKHEVSSSVSLPLFVPLPHGRPCWFNC